MRARPGLAGLGLGLAGLLGACAIPSTTASLTPRAHASACTNLTEIATWPLARRAYQLVVVPVAETAVTSVAGAVDAGAGGVILFGSSAPADLAGELATLERDAPGGIAPFVMTDEEGGEVQRMANLVGSLPWPRTMAETMTIAAVTALATRVARAMRRAGVTMDLAPVLDLASGPGPDALHTDGPRSFSPSAPVATAYGLAFARGLLAGGVVPVVKHFPGEGSASANTDDAPASTPSLSSLEHADLLPFEAAIAAKMPAVMVGNATVPGLTALPASLSAAAVTGLLRDRLGFHGLVLTDSLTAGAITARHLSLPEAALEAVEAGADLVLFNASAPDRAAHEVAAALVGAVRSGALPVATLDGAVAEVLAAKHVALCRA